MQLIQKQPRSTIQFRPPPDSDEPNVDMSCHMLLPQKLVEEGGHQEQTYYLHVLVSAKRDRPRRLYLFRVSCLDVVQPIFYFSSVIEPPSSLSPPKLFFLSQVGKLSPLGRAVFNNDSEEVERLLSGGKVHYAGVPCNTLTPFHSTLSSFFVCYIFLAYYQLLCIYRV
jgi:hypothetical protein